MKLKTEAKIGIITIVALTLGYIGLNFLKGIDLFKRESIYYVKFADLNGVAKATPVIISGYKVGSVRQVEFEYRSSSGYGAVVTIAIDPEVNIPQGGELTIRKNLLTGSELVLMTKKIHPGYISPGDTIPSIEAPQDLMAVASEKILPSIVETMPQIVKTIERLNELLSNKRIDTMLMSLGQTSQELEQTIGKINRSMNDLPGIMSNVRTASSSFASIGQHVEQIRVDTLMHNLNILSANLSNMSSQLSTKQGTAGLLLSDPSLYNRLDSLALSADLLMKDLKENPKRYVHFSLF
ncbi:MAG: MlaD family protein [Porphyromonadaceae bacterium]|nr:MlaD family protein [Porphyromonadaceae bacterium]